jgi:hypothetical protein
MNYFNFSGAFMMHSCSPHFTDFGRLFLQSLTKSLRIRIYAYTIRILFVATMISAGLTYTVAQYYSQDDLRELVRKSGRRSKRTRKSSDIETYDDQ